MYQPPLLSGFEYKEEAISEGIVSKPSKLNNEFSDRQLCTNFTPPDNIPVIHLSLSNGSFQYSHIQDSTNHYLHTSYYNDEVQE